LKKRISRNRGKKARKFHVESGAGIRNGQETGQNGLERTWTRGVIGGWDTGIRRDGDQRRNDRRGVKQEDFSSEKSARRENQMTRGRQ